MVVLLIVMGVTAVWMAADLPAWKQQATREKEAELVFRGQQYVRALRLYQGRNGPGSAPTEIDALVTGKFLRKKYKDPITNDDFDVVYRATAPIVPGQSPPGTQQQTPGRPGGPAPAPGVQPPGRGAQPQTPAPGQGAGQGAGQGSGQTFGGPITGVRSKSTASSIMLYLGATHYNEWQFLYSGQTQQGGGPGGANRGGGPGAPGQPGGPGGVGPGIGGGAGRGGPGGPGGPGGVQGPGRGGAPTGPAVPGGAGRGRGGLS